MDETQPADMAADPDRPGETMGGDPKVDELTRKIAEALINAWVDEEMFDSEETRRLVWREAYLAAEVAAKFYEPQIEALTKDRDAAEQGEADYMEHHRLAEARVERLAGALCSATEDLDEATEHIRRAYPGQDERRQAQLDAEAAWFTQEAGRFRVILADQPTGETLGERERCLVCGGLVPDPNINTPRVEGETYCTPLRCPAWKVTACYDYELRDWVPVESKPTGETTNT